MHIGIDIDDTITNSWECLIPYYTKIFNISEDILHTSKPYYNAVSHLMSLEEYYKLMLPVYDEVIPNVTLKPYVKETIDKLYDLGYHVTFITARGKDHTDAYKTSKEYLDKHHIKYDKIMTNIHDKAKACHEENVTLFIDDSARNCEDVASSGIETLMFETYYNKDYQDVKHIKDWNEVYEYLKGRIQDGK